MKIGIFDEKYAFRVSWYDDDEGEGGSLGQEHSRGVEAMDASMAKAKERRTSEDWEHYEYLYVERAAQQWYAALGPRATEVTIATVGYVLENERLARELLKVGRNAVKNAKLEWDSGVPWPEWARTAQANGWKPPKGWKP